MVEINDEHVDYVDESGSFEAMPAPHQRDKFIYSGQNLKGDQSTMARLDVASSKMPKLGKFSPFDASVVPGSGGSHQCKSIQKKPKILTSKICEFETHVNSQGPQEAERCR